MNQTILDRMKNKGVSQEEAFAFFDSLEPITNDFMMGNWRGSECKTGHLMDGLLTIAPWYGKQFFSSEAVHPLMMIDKKGQLYAVNPRKVFGFIKSQKIMSKVSSFADKVVQGEKQFNRHTFDIAMKRYRTTKPYARLREINFRGGMTSAMIYDELPIIDVFKKIDEQTVLGVMDIKGEFGRKGYFFLLERE